MEEAAPFTTRAWASCHVIVGSSAGAAPARAVSRVAIRERLEGRTADPMEHMSDEQYRA